MRIVLTGIYNKSKKRPGSDEVAYSVFNTMKNLEETYFVTKFSVIKPHSIWQKLFGLKQEGNLYYAGFLRMPGLIKKLNPDILHAINFDPFVGLLFLVFRHWKVKKVYTVHGVIRYENSRKPYLSFFFKLRTQICEKCIYRFMDYSFVYFEKIVEQIRRYYPFDITKSGLTINGIASSLGTAMEGGAIPPAKQLHIVALGGLMDRISGIEILFDALTGCGIDFKLTVVGQKEQLVTPQQHLGRVTYINKLPVNEYSQLLLACDVYICLSLFESFSIGTVDAMAMGCAVIVSENVGISQYIKNGVDGYVVNIEKPMEVRKILIMLNENRELLIKVGDEARKVRDIFTWNAVSEKYLHEYRKILGE